MAKSATARDVSDSESDDARPVASKKGATSGASKSNGHGATEQDEGGDDDESGEEEEEFEIELIIDHQRGMFQEGRTGYLVKWKGYTSNDNSWVDERDAVGAKDLISDYWQNLNKSTKAKTASVSKGRKSASAKKPPPPSDPPSEPEESPAPPKKRGRPPKSDSASAALAHNDESESEEPKKKPRKGAAAGSASASVSASAAKSASKAAGKRAAPPPPPPADSSEEEAENEYQDMQRLFKSARSWESHIEKIDTIERTVEGGLMVYFTLKNGMGFGRESSEICKQKMPLKLIEFYESNLKWKRVDEDNDAMAED